MGKIIRNHWARLVVLVAAAIQIAGSIEGFFWPKSTWDFCTSSLDILVKPFPTLQIVNLVLGITVLAWEWPLGFLAGNMLHRSIHARLVVCAICAVLSTFLYQAHSSTIYYLLGIYGYTLALMAREIVYPEPWTVSLIDETPTLNKPYLDPKQGLKDYFSLTSEYDVEKNFEDDGTTSTIESTCEISDHTSGFRLDKKIDSIPTRNPEFIPILNLAPIKRSPIELPAVRFQSPLVQEVGHLFELNRKQKDSSNPYKRTRARTWHHESLNVQD